MDTVFKASISFLPLAASLNTHIDPAGQLKILDVGKTGIEEGETRSKISIYIQDPLFNKLEVCQANLPLLVVHVVLSSGIKKGKPFHVPLCVHKLTDWDFTCMKLIINMDSNISTLENNTFSRRYYDWSIRC